FPTSAGRNPPPGPAHRAVPTLWSELPKIFLGDVLGHQFGQHLVFGLDLFFQKLDPLLFRLVIWTALALEGGRTILEELLLPTVEHRQCYFAGVAVGRPCNRSLLIFSTTPA